MMFSAVLLCSLLVSSSCSDLQHKVFRNLLRLCPAQYIPTDNSTAVNISSEAASCCTDDFNQFTEKMFYSNTTSYLDDSQSCLYPTTHPSISKYQTRKSYYMITNAPVDGCFISDSSTLEITNESSQPTCNDSEIIPFKRFLPVSSKSNGFIYKNRHCAYCHGHYELTDWKATATCLIMTSFGYDLTNCKFKFVYPGPVDDIQHLECFTDTFNSCPEKYAEKVNIPAKLDLSVNELAEACSVDGLPRFKNYYFSKNVFCFICHYCRSDAPCPFTECRRPPDPDGRGVQGYVFSRILDSRVVNQNMHASHQDETICGLEPDLQICHKVMCPEGQLITGDGKSRICQMDSTRWIAKNSKFVMWLLLDFDHSMTVNDAALEKLLKRNQFQNPWRASWNLEAFYRPFARNFVNGDSSTMTKAQLVDNFSHAYLQISYKQNSVNPATFVRDIDNTLPKMLSFKIDNTLHRARQAFSKYTLLPTKMVETKVYSEPTWHLSPDFHPHDRILYKPVFKRVVSHGTSEVTRLLFCRQVELPSTNFNSFDTHLDRRVALYYNRTGKYLFENEFTEIITQTNDRRYRICISDTEIKSAAGRGKCTTWLLVAVLCMLLV